MDRLLQLLKPVVESKSKNETLKNFLLSCADQRAFSKGPSGISSFVGLINTKLNEPSSRLDGLHLLQVFLPQCTMDVLAQNGSSWMQFCLKGTPIPNSSQVSFLILTSLLELSRKVPELTKTVSSNVVPNLAEQVHQGILPQSYLCALECLELCMTSYSGPCGPHRKVLERFLLSLVNYEGPQRLKVFWQAARCMALLPQIGGGGTGGTLHRCAWAAQQKSLCRTIHLLLDNLYADTNELQVNLMGGMLESVEPLPLTAVEDVDPVLKTQKLTAHLTAVSAFLQAMLAVHFPVPKNISVSSILNVICRGLAVNGNSLGPSTTNHSLALVAVLPNIHYSLLKLLEALILVARMNLLPYAGLICRIAMQTLKWTRVDKWAYGTDRPFSFLRIQAYRILTLWCGVAKTGSLIEDVADQLVDLSLHDIHSEKDSVSLSAALSRKNKFANRKVQKMKASQDIVNQSAIPQDSLFSMASVNETANIEVCTAALQSLRAMLSASSSKIQAALHKVIQETVVAILLQLTSHSGEPVIPYSASKPRLELYRVMLQLVLDSHTVWPAPTNVALKLFAKGLNDSNAEVSMFCGMAQSSLEKIIHPAYASLQLTASNKDMEACQVENFESPALCSTFNPVSQNGGHNNSNADGQELTDAATLTQGELQKHSVNNGSRKQVTLIVHSPKDDSPTADNASQRKDLMTPSPAPLRRPVLRNDTKLTTSTPHVVIEKLNESSKEVDSSTSELQKLNLSSKSESVNGEETADKEISSVRNFHLCEGRTKVKKSPEKEVHVDEMIDITGSDKSDEEISQVLCEIDLADSEDDKSSISICSQSTISSPLAEKGSKVVSCQKSDKETAKENVPETDVAAGQIELCTGVPQDNDVTKNDSLSESNRTEELLEEEREKSPSPPPATPPRVLRSRTISNSSSAPNTPSRKNSRKTIVIDATLEEEEMLVHNVEKVEAGSIAKPTENGLGAVISQDKQVAKRPVDSPETKAPGPKAPEPKASETKMSVTKRPETKAVEIEASVPETKELDTDVSVAKPLASGEKRAADVENDGLEFKKPRISEDDDNYVYDDDLDEEAMLSTFIDVTQGEEGF